MRVLVALTLLLAVSCTFDYGPLRGTPQDDAGAGEASVHAADAPLWRDTLSEVAVEEAGGATPDAVGVWDAAPDLESAADVPVSQGVDAAPEAGPAFDDAGEGTETGGAGGNTGQGGVSGTGGAFDGGSAGGSSGPGGAVGSGGIAGNGGVDGGATTTGGEGGAVVDGGRDTPVDASADSQALTDAEVDAGEADASADAMVCAPGQNACVGNVYCSCNTAGTGCATTIQDCGPTSVCDLSLGGCVVVDTAPFDPNNTTGFSSRAVVNTCKLNFYSVGAARTLLRIEQYLGMLAETPLSWVIYRSSTKDGTYALGQTFDGLGTPSAGGYQSSPVLSYALEANVYYAIGVCWGSSSATYWYHTGAATFPISLSPSSGLSVLSGVSSSTVTTTTPPSAPASVTWSSSSTLYYPQRLSTR